MSLILEATLKVSLVVLIGLTLAGLLRRRSAALRHWILAATIACAAAMPLLELLLPAWSMARFATAPGPVAAPAVAAQPPAAGHVGEVLSFGEQRPTATTPIAPARQFLLPAWLVGVGLSTMILVVGLLRLAWLARRAERIVSGPWVRITAEIGREYGLDRPIELLQSDHPSLLVTWGLIRPRVIVPRVALTWPDDRIQVVVRHELAHIRRGDWVVQLAGEALRAAYWFNPLLWIACARLRDESEQACDDEVLQRIAGTDYATHLLELARALKAEAAPRVPAPAVARSSSLERRVRAMLDAHLTRTPTSRTARFAVGAIMLALTVGIASAQTGPSVLSGSIVDSTGAPVPGVTVTLTNTATKAKFQVATDDSGRYQFVPLPSAQYEMEATYPAFKKTAATINLAGNTMRHDLTLALGQLKETVTVVSDGAEKPSGSGSAPASSISPTGRDAYQKALTECKPSASGGRVRPPHKIKDVKPVYPAHLAQSAIGGSVELQATVGTDGTVREVTVLKSVHPDLDAAAVEAVKGWVFDGTLLNCEPVDVVFTATINFSTR